MKNLRISKRALSVLVAGIVLTTFSGCNKKNTDDRQENLVGHIDVLNPKDISSSDFICYNVGNHSNVGITEQGKMLEQCQKNDISVGIIIDCDATSRLDIFEDIEFTKSIIEQNDIDLPVYLNVENIMKNDNLCMTEKADLLGEFLTLIGENNIYVGLYGTSTSLSNLNQYGFPISERYDCFVVEDGITEYTGLSSIRQDVEGNIKSTYQSVDYGNDLAKFIKSKNLNNASALKQNGYYVVEENSDIEKVAIKYDLSVNELLKFNRLEKTEVLPGTVLRIPNQLQNKKELVFPTLKRQDKALYRGIDISCYQEESPNVGFDEISRVIDFAILKIGEQANKDFKELREDPKFEYFYNSCVENDLAVGGYYVTHATTVNDAIAEANLVVNRIKDLDITFPIFMDFENSEGTIYEKEFNEIKKNGGFEQMLESANKVFQEAGFRFGIYTNLSTYSDMVDMVGLETLNKYEIWLSKPNDYTDINQVIDYGPTCKTDNGNYSFACDMNQVSWTIGDLGIGNAEGYVDYNLCYVDYKAPKQLVELPPEYTFETLNYKRTDWKKVGKTAGTVTGGTIGSLVVLYVIGHRKIYKKRLKKLIKQMSNKRVIDRPKRKKLTIVGEPQKVL